jgi:hypothetical protein
MSNDIRYKLQNIELIVRDIRDFPQTYKTILKKDCKDGTCQFVLRKKINKLLKDGTICKTTIPGTRFGALIFYTIPKDYYILIESERIGSNVFVFFDFKNISRYYIKVKKYWILKEGKWNLGNGEKMFFEGKVLKFI